MIRHLVVHGMSAQQTLPVAGVAVKVCLSFHHTLLAIYCFHLKGASVRHDWGSLIMQRAELLARPRHRLVEEADFEMDPLQ